MLKQLLNIKYRRERGLRAELVKLADEELRLCSQREALHARRHALHAEWRAQAAQSGYFNQNCLEQLRSQLLQLENEDQALQRQLEALAAERAQLVQTRAEQEALLRRNLREQEKLSQLLTLPQDEIY